MARPIKESDKEKTIIKQIMREKNVSMEELAIRMGKAKSTVSNLLTRQNMTIDTLALMADALGVEVADLFPVKPGYVHYMEAKYQAERIRGVNTPNEIDEAEKALFDKFKQWMQTQE